MQSRRQFLKQLMVGVPPLVIGAGRGLAAVPSSVCPVDLRFLSDSVRLMRRVVWTDAYPPTPSRLRLASEFDRMTIHHAGNGINLETDRNAVIHSLNGVLAAHEERAYGDIGYHFIVDYAGRVWEGRSLMYEGAHVCHQNERNIGVMLLGNFEKQQPSSEQVSSLVRVTYLLRKRYRIKKHRVYGHRDLGATVCPGRYLYPRVCALKA